MVNRGSARRQGSHPDAGNAEGTAGGGIGPDPAKSHVERLSGMAGWHGGGGSPGTPDLAPPAGWAYGPCAGKTPAGLDNARVWRYAGHHLPISAVFLPCCLSGLTPIKQRRYSYVMHNNAGDNKC